MEKKFTKFELARMKRTAQNVDQYLNKKNKLVSKIEELNNELNSVNQLIELTDAPTRAMTGGFGTEDIIRKVVTPTDKLDKNGNMIKQTTYEFIYESIIPPMIDVTIKANTSINVEDWVNAEPENFTIVPSTEGMVGSDFDADSVQLEANHNLEDAE